MKMTNAHVLIKPDETPQDIIAEICSEYNIKPDEHFAFSAVMRQSKEKDCKELMINRVAGKRHNAYTVCELVNNLYANKKNSNINYVQAPIDDWLVVFEPLINDIVNQTYESYKNTIQDKRDMLSIMYMTIMRLYNRGYYLHKNLICRAFKNDLNRECNKRNTLALDSLDVPIYYDDDGKEVTRLDIIPDPDTIEDEDKEYWEHKLAVLKERMLNDMSELQYKRILLQLESNTVERSTSYVLEQYRQLFNPNYVPRPNSKGKNRGGKK